MSGAVKILQEKLMSFGCAVTGVMNKDANSNTNTRNAIREFKRKTKFSPVNGYIDDNVLKSIDSWYKKNFVSKPLKASYYKGWNKDLEYGNDSLTAVIDNKYQFSNAYDTVKKEVIKETTKKEEIKRDTTPIKKEEKVPVIIDNTIKPVIIDNKKSVDKEPDLMLIAGGVGIIGLIVYMLNKKKNKRK